MSSTAEEIPANESPAQRQARLRRERRNAKIQAGGASRLEAITSLSGRPAPAPETPSQTPVPVKTASVEDVSLSTSHPDPDEGDISEHYYKPQTTARPQQDIPSGGSTIPGATTNPFSLAQAQAGSQALPEDPIFGMMQQLLNPNGSASPFGSAGGAGGLPPGLAQMFGNFTGQQPDAQAQPEAAAPSTAYVWRIIHAVASLSLALYVALTSSFTGSKLSRYAHDINSEHLIGQRFFYLFATFELVLQTSRFFIERGQLAPSGVLGTLSQALPEPYSGYIRVIGRYSVIYTTISADAMVAIFVLGLVAWWKGAEMV